MFRSYSLPELSAASRSSLRIDPEFFASGPEDYVLVNGLYRPVLLLTADSPSILRMVHAHGAGPLLMSLSGEGEGAGAGGSRNCSLTILAWDGVYLEERLELSPAETLNLVAAGRVEVEVLCHSLGTFQMVENGEVLFYLKVAPASPSPVPPRPVVSTEALRGIVRPWYLQDLLWDNETEAGTGKVDSNYSLFVTQENFDPHRCGFWFGVGGDCAAISPYGPALPNTTANELCGFHQFGGQRGVDPVRYTTDRRLITFTGAVNEWVLYGLGTAFHPLHVHVNHMQIVSWSSRGGEDGASAFYRRGQWRDTIPPIADQVRFRFRAADYEGETVLHCHFQRHEDLGMMDTFLVMNRTAYDRYRRGATHPGETVSSLPASFLTSRRLSPSLLSPPRAQQKFQRW
jgi:FtsP/CotA-like multicopper oxidase with cupredoxin domain